MFSITRYLLIVDLKLYPFKLSGVYGRLTDIGIALCVSLLLLQRFQLIYEKLAQKLLLKTYES